MTNLRENMGQDYYPNIRWVWPNNSFALPISSKIHIQYYKESFFASLLFEKEMRTSNN